MASSSATATTAPILFCAEWEHRVLSLRAQLSTVTEAAALLPPNLPTIFCAA